MSEYSDWDIFLLYKKTGSIEQICNTIGNDNKDEVEALCRVISEKFKEHNAYVDSIIKDFSEVDFPLTLWELRIIYNSLISFRALNESDRKITSELISRIEQTISQN